MNGDRIMTALIGVKEYPMRYLALDAWNYINFLERENKKLRDQLANALNVAYETGKEAVL